MKTDLTIFDDGDDFNRGVNDLNAKSLADLPLGELSSLGVSLYGYSQGLDRRAALLNYLAGRVLFEIRERLPKERSFTSWITEKKLARSTVYMLIGLFERVPNIESIRGLTVMEAYTKFGVLPPRKKLKALPEPDDMSADEPEKHALQPAGGADGESVQSEGIGGRLHEQRFEEREGEDVIDVPPEVITVDRETLQELLKAISKDIVKSVVMECFEGVKAKVVDCLEISDEEMPLVDSAFGGVVSAHPIEPDARFEVFLDEMYSAIHRVQDAGLLESAKEAAWLLEKMVVAFQGRLKRVG
jgi:hypothetical protein